MNNIKYCAVFGAGDYGSMTPEQLCLGGCFIIAADGGLSYLRRYGIAPDRIIGDFDSLGELPCGENVITLPKEKDDTDMLASVRLGLGMGFRGFYLLGGLGGRLDHTLANIQTLAFISENGGFGYLVSGDTVITVCGGERLVFSSGMEGDFSVFAHGGNSTGVSISGMKYCLEGAELGCSFPVGVSNEFLPDEAASAECCVGKLTVIWQNSRENRKAGLFPERAFIR